MVIFIDESGIHKQTDHSTTAIVYVEIKNRQKIEQDIDAILKNLKIESFHWAKHGWKIKEKFLKKIINLTFFFKIATFKNPVKTDLMMEQVFKHLIIEKDIKQIFIDGKKPKWYERKLKKVLRDKGLSVKKLRTVKNESSYPGIQLADALAGVVRDHINNPDKKDSKRWFRKFKKEKKLTAQFIF